MTATLRSVVAEHDTRGVRALLRANNPEAGLLVAAAAPDFTHRIELGWVLLEALGKRPDVTGQGRDDQLNWEVLHAWLIAHYVKTVVLLDAQWLPPQFIADLAGLVATCGLDLWLIAHLPVPEVYGDALSAWPHRDSRGGELVAALGLANPGSADAATSKRFPTVPEDNWPTFRHACAQGLAPEDFVLVDALFQKAFRAALPAFAADDVSEASVLTHLREALHQAATVSEMTVIIRGVQVAAHRSGWLLQVDPARLRNTAETMSRAAVNSPDTWRQLRAYRLPYRGAAVALAAAELNVGDMQRLRCRDVLTEGRRVVVAGQPRAVPDGADLYLRAQLNYRRFAGADDGDLLFADDAGPLRDRALADALRYPARELGIPVLDIARVRAPDPTSMRWRDRWGITLQRLTR